jgi:hypothetical protein
MKTKQFITGILSILTIYCFTLTFTGCNSDDDDDDNGPTTVAYRIAEIVSTDIYDSNLYEDKDLYNYINERLTEVIDLDKENGIWVENRKIEYEYDGDWVSSKRYNKEGDNWEEEDMMSSEQIKIVKGKVLEIRYTYSNDVYSEVFTYSGDKLITIESFDNGEIDYKYVFTYNGENLQEVIEYYYNEGVEEMDYKYEFSYVNGNLTEMLESYFNNGVWEYHYKYVYLYSGNKVIQINDYDYYNDSWQLDDSEYFSYNSLGLLESISESGEGWTWEQIYTYEEGIGNYRLLQGDGGYYDIFNYPTAQRMDQTITSPDDRRFNLKRFLLR